MLWLPTHPKPSGFTANPFDQASEGSRPIDPKERQQATTSKNVPGKWKWDMGNSLYIYIYTYTWNICEHEIYIYMIEQHIME